MAGYFGSVSLKMSETSEKPLHFDRDLHKKYVKSLEIEKPERFEYWVTEHLRVSGIYWGFVAMSMMNALDEMDVKKASEFVLACQRNGGGFGGHTVHDAHIVTTYNALQVRFKASLACWIHKPRLTVLGVSNGW